MDFDLLIRDAGLRDGRRLDVGIDRGRVVAIGAGLAGDAQRTVDARGGLLLPGLHDHHIHLAATAAALSSVACGPPDVGDAEGLLRALRNNGGTGWLRGIGYHESVAGSIDRDWIDRAIASRPVRIQHRSGRMWYLNSMAIECLIESGPPPAGMERADGRWTGRLFDSDGWLRVRLGGTPPPLDEIGAQLAARGVTGVTDMNPENDRASGRYLEGERLRGALPQRLLLAGKDELAQADFNGIATGPLKLHLHESELPDFEATIAQIRDAHGAGRAVAVHCVTDVELVFTLGVLREAGTIDGDRIEHASVASDELVEEIADMSLKVVTQPHFVAERGDRYRADIAEGDWPKLYRLRSFMKAGVVLAGGSDAPFGRPDPWSSMAAAVSRRTADGVVLGADEALTPEAALDLFLAAPTDLARTRCIEHEAVADLVLLNQPWRVLRDKLGDAQVRATIIDGRIVHDAIDQTPVQGSLRADPFS